MKEIKVKYEKHPDYRMLPVGGAFGSINPQGMVVCDFYLERFPTPDKTTLVIDESTGNLDETKSNEDDKLLVRELSVGIVMQPDIARLIGEWLIKKSDEYNQLIGKKP